MIETCKICLALVGPLYYAISILAYHQYPSMRRFLLLVIFPLPIALFLGYLLSTYENSENGHEIVIMLLVFISVAVGSAVLSHCLMDLRRKDIWLFLRIIAASMLFITPLLLWFPEFFWAITALFFIIGILFGIYGYFTYYSGKDIGLAYLYGSILFMVIAPVISLIIIRIYNEAMQDEIIYRHSQVYEVTCHQAAIPNPFEEEGFQLPMFFSFGYIGLVGILTGIRKTVLERNLKEKEVIPKEYYEVIKEKK